MVILILILLGVCFGSFIGAFHWRLHEGKNFTTDRSICEHCNHELAWIDLIPLLSWLSLVGKCRYCKKPIGFIPPALEVGTAFIFVVSYLYWPYQIIAVSDIVLFGLWLVILVGLIVLFVYDLRWFLLPDVIVFPLIGLAFMYRVYEAIIVGTSFIDFIGAILIGLLIGGGIFWLLFQVSGGRWIGGGDVKLGFLMGVLLGPLNAFIALLIGFYSATLVVLPLLLTKRITRKSKVPFGPFLIVGLIVTMLFSEYIHKWYTLYFGL